MKPGSKKLSKLELLLSLSIVAFIGGPIGYRVYQVYNVFPGDSATETTMVRIAYAKTDGLQLKELLVMEEDAPAEPAIMDFSNRQFTRINISDFQITMPERNDATACFFDPELKPIYSFKENILLFSGVDTSLMRKQD